MKVYLFAALIMFVAGLSFTQYVNIVSLQRHLRHPTPNVGNSTNLELAVYALGLLLMVAAPVTAIAALIAK